MATRRSRSWSKHLARRVMETLIQWLMHVTARTCRWEFIDCHAAEKALFDNDQGVILITPHENVISVLTLALAGWPFKGKVIISNHQTVDWVYKIVEKLGIGLIIVDKNDPSQNVNEQVKETLAKGIRLSSPLMGRWARHINLIRACGYWRAGTELKLFF